MHLSGSYDMSYVITFDIWKVRLMSNYDMLFSYSVISMIGYGSVVPRTETGKITLICYACIGIPVYILYFMNMGKIFAAVLKWVYTKAYRWNVRRKWKQSVNYDPMANTGEDVELDEAYLDELEQQVRYFPIGNAQQYQIDGHYFLTCFPYVCLYFRPSKKHVQTR